MNPHALARAGEALLDNEFTRAGDAARASEAVLENESTRAGAGDTLLTGAWRGALLKRSVLQVS